MAEPVESGPDAGLRIDTIVKQYGRYPALRGVSLDVQPGEFVALLGPSGSGKTTLLRTLAGLETPDSGQVRLGGQDFLALSPRARRVGMVFQHYALFRHMTVASNIAFGLEVRPRRERPSKAEIADRVARLLALVQLEGLGNRYPAQLSGGQRQRVALARALAIEPRLLLLDEPFGALDATVRKELRHHLRRIHDETGLTTLFVTHDQEEALDLADRVAVLREGRLLQVGAPRTLLDAPQSAFVHAFLGETNRLHGLAHAGRVLIAGEPWLSPPPRAWPTAPLRYFSASTKLKLSAPTKAWPLPCLPCIVRAEMCGSKGETRAAKRSKSTAPSPKKADISPARPSMSDQPSPASTPKTRRKRE